MPPLASWLERARSRLLPGSCAATWWLFFDRKHGTFWMTAVFLSFLVSIEVLEPFDLGSADFGPLSLY